MMNKSEVRYMFLRDSKFHPVGCLAIHVETGKKNVSYQLSVLNPQDRFNRSLARHLAAGRLLEKPFSVSLKNKNSNLNDVTKAVMEDLSKSEDVPARAIKAAKFWLNGQSW